MTELELLARTTAAARLLRLQREECAATKWLFRRNFMAGIRGLVRL